jgi:exosortase/archaeosortase family protein
MGILFFSFVLAYPAPLRLKLTGLPLGMALIHAGNILRIAGLFVIGVQSHALFEVTHVYFGQVLMVLFVLAVCLGWLKVCSNSKPGLLMPETEPLTRERDLFSFLIRLFAFTGVAFLLWLPLNKEYVKLADQVVTPLFSLFNYRLAIPYQHAIYYQTFNVVTFTGVVLATRIKPRTRKFGMFVAGFAVIFILHVLFRVCSVLISAFHNEPAERLAAAISICGQYILPMALWLLMVRRAKTASDLTNSHRFLNKTCMFRKN